MSHTTGDIIVDVITVHTYEPDSPFDEARCACGAQPLDGFPQHIARMIQHAIATRSVGNISDTKLKILAGDYTPEELATLAMQGVDAFDLLRAMVEQDVETFERAACNGTVEGPGQRARE